MSRSIMGYSNVALVSLYCHGDEPKNLNEIEEEMKKRNIPYIEIWDKIDKLMRELVDKWESNNE